MITPDRSRALLLLADSLDDLERTRIAMANRCKATAKKNQKSDGLSSVVNSSVAGLLEVLEESEKRAVKDLEKMLREHPLGAWVKSIHGIGDKQGARLIASLGDPAWNYAENRLRRGPAELWAYAGLHVVDGKRPRRKKGQQANWNPTTKMRAILVAKSCMMKRDSPYREVYERAREAWADRDTTDMHKLNHALGVTAKAILKDLFLQAKALHERVDDGVV